MKRLTWALLSLMLFFGMGTAFADVEQPVITPSTGSAVTIGDMVTITCETPGATIYYATDKDYGISNSDIEYTGSFALTEAMIRTSGSKKGSIVIKAIAYVGEDESMVSTATYSEVTIPGAEPEEIAKPVITPASGSAVTIGDMVTITCGTTGATIHYTTANTFVTESDPVYTEPFALTEAMIKTSGMNEGKIIIKAVAYLNGENSDPASVTYEDITIPTPTPDPEEIAKPVITPASGSAVTIGDMVTITCGTTGATIHYTTTNTFVTESDPVYTEPFALTEAMIKTSGMNEGKIIIKAVAYLNGENSDPASVTYEDITIPTPPPAITVARPVITPDNSVGKIKLNEKVTITCSTEGALIYYTLDGNEPTAESTLYEAPFLLPETTPVDQEITIRAIAIKEGVASEKAQVNLMVEAAGEGPDNPDDPVTPGLPETVKAPVFEPSAGEVEKGTAIAWTWDEAYDYEIMGVVYVANGKDEDLDIDEAGFVELVSAWQDEEEDMVREDGVVYLYYEGEGAYEIAQDATLKARLVLGMTKAELEEGDDEPGIEIVLSPVVEAAYTVKEEPVIEMVATPTFNPEAGEVEAGTKVEIACTTEDAVIYYTVDGTEPTAESAEYKEAIAVDSAMTIKAIAIKGEAKSEVATAAYTLKVANEDLELAGVTVYPNPSKGVFNLELPVASTVEVFAINGVLTQRFSANAGNTTLTINRNGIYFLRITGDGRTAIKRVIVNQ